MLLLAAVLLTVGVVAFLNRDDLARAVGLMVRARAGWLAAAVVATAVVYLCRALVYDITLRMMGSRVGLPYLWRSAVVATSIHQLVPSGGLSGYAFLTYAFHARGVAAGAASLTALIDTLSNAASVAILVVASLPYLGLTHRLGGGELAALLAPGVVIVPLAAGVFWLQARRDRLRSFVLVWQDRLQSLLGRRWSQRPVVDFIDQYFAGKAVISRRPATFFVLVGLQLGALALDCGAVYAVFLGLGLRPDPVLVAVGFVVSLIGLTVVAVPGGGGSAEVIMSAFFGANGIAPDTAIAATLLYRIVSFWLPIGFSTAVLWRWWGSRRNRPRPDSR